MSTFFVGSLILLFVSQVIAIAWLLFLHFRKEDLSPQIKVFGDAQLQELNGRMAILETTWTDVYSKLRRVMGRIDKVGSMDVHPPAEAAPATEAELKAAIMRKARFGA